MKGVSEETGVARSGKARTGDLDTVYRTVRGHGEGGGGAGVLVGW